MASASRSGALHADADDAEADAVARRDGLRQAGEWMRVRGRSCGSSGAPAAAASSPCRKARRDRLLLSMRNSSDMQLTCARPSRPLERCYFFSGLMATSLKKTMSLSL